MAPVAARLSLGLNPERLGPVTEQFTVLEWPAVCDASWPPNSTYISNTCGHVKQYTEKN